VLSRAFRSAARWLWPSVVAACAGTLVAGLVEGVGEGGVVGAIASAGFLALLVLPCLLVASLAVRALWIAWKPSELALVEANGGAPRLAAWALVIMLGAFALAWAMFAGTWQLANLTAFKPLPMSFAEPIVAVTAALAIAILSRPVARAATALARIVDARWTRSGRASLVSPTRIALAIAVLAMGVVYALWRLMVLPRIGTLDLTPLRAPVAGIAALALAHVAWNRLARVRRFAGPALAVLAAGTIATALCAWRTDPSLTLSIWGDRPIAGLAIDQLFDLDRIREGISLAAFAPTPRADAPHPDIILVTIDTVRADHTPPYGGHAEMPILHQLAQRGTVFEWAFSPSNVTRRSIPSMIIGLAPDRVRGRVVGWALRVDPRHVLLPERLRAGGYETAGFMCCGGIWGKEARTGLARGLEHLEIEPRENGFLLAKAAHAWLDQRAAAGDHKPLFLWMHLLEPHNWQAAYGEPRNDEERRRNYDRTLASSDRMLGELLAAYANRPPEQAPIIIVTADHGEALGDHGQPNHSTDLYDSQIHVPLVIAGPGIQPGRIAETVSLTDLAPTVLDLAGFAPVTDAGIDGTSFAALATGRRSADPEGGVAYSAMIKDRSNPGGITAVVHGRWKLVDNGSSIELYDVHADPDERSNLVAVKPQLLAPLRILLHEREVRAEVPPF
jgi:arylsulfatase A-like enzyme